MAVKERQALTVRFDNPEVYEMLSWLASETHVSMNSLVQKAVQDLVAREAATLEKRLQSALEVVQRYRAEDVEQYIASFAHAEVSEDDPNRAVAYLSEAERLSAGAPVIQAVE